MLGGAEIDAYLSRIGYDGPRDPTPATLRALHRAHVYSVPFENLDIHLGRPIPVAVAPAFDKVVGARRGGYCYELNPLFHALLTALGFEVTICSARMMLRDDGHLFDHVTLIVRLDGADWLADVGNGRQSPPMPLAHGAAADWGDGTGRFRIERRGAEYVVLGSRGQGAFETIYGFAPKARELHQFEDRSCWTQSSPDSIFTKAPLCTLPIAGGRVTVSGLNLIRTTGEAVETRRMTTAERAALLRDRFGIDLGNTALPDGANVAFRPGWGPDR